DAQLRQGRAAWRALIIPAGLSDPEALRDLLAERQAPARLIDLAAGSRAMVTAWRSEALWSLGMAAIVIIGLLWLRLRRPREVLAVALPPAAALLVTAAVMSRFDGGLSIAHLVGLLLTAGIGLDYALFSRSFRGDPPAVARSRRAINTCAASTGG